MQIYIVREGDTLNSIAAAFGLPPAEISYINQLVYPYRLAVGQALLLGAPGGSLSAAAMLILLLKKPFCRPRCHT